MNVETKLTCSADYLERFRPNCLQDAWKFVAMGLWSESPYHSGECLYEITKNVELNTWVIVSSDIIPDDDDDIDDDDDDDIDDDDGAAIMNGKVEIPANSADRDPEKLILPAVIAICRDAPENATTEEMAEAMYEVLWEIGLGLEE